MKTISIFQVQGDKKAHYIATTSKTKAIEIGKEVYPTEKINFASDFTHNFTKEELENLPDYVITKN